MEPVPLAMFVPQDAMQRCHSLGQLLPEETDSLVDYASILIIEDSVDAFEEVGLLTGLVPDGLDLVDALVNLFVGVAPVLTFLNNVLAGSGDIQLVAVAWHWTWLKVEGTISATGRGAWGELWRILVTNLDTRDDAFELHCCRLVKAKSYVSVSWERAILPPESCHSE